MRAEYESQEREIDRSEETRLYLGEIKTQVDKSLHNYLQIKWLDTRRLNTDLAWLVDRFGEFVRTGGKRIRPAFFMAGYEGFGGQNLKGAIYTSMACELVHAAVLVHDDIIDNSDLRRGRPSLHRLFTQDYNNENFGRSLAIIAGDTLVAYAIDVLSTSSLMDSPSGKRARRVFDRMCLEVGYGELMDMLAVREKLLSDPQIIRMMEHKSARYSVARPLKMGAVLAGATERDANILYTYGRHLGVAFQLQDDILGIFGTEAKLGKPVDSDIKEGKTTLLVSGTIQALKEIGRQDDLMIFLRLLGNPRISPDDFEWVKNLMVETGSLAKAKQIVADRTQRALKILPHAEGLNPKQRMFLEGIAEYLVEREV